MLILSLDNLAHRYGCLPSEVMARATTFDMYVLDVSSRWSRHQADKSQGRVPVKKMPTEREMMDMLKRARGQDG